MAQPSSSNTTTSRKRKRTGDEWGRSANNLQRKVRRRDDKVDELEAKIEGMEVDAAAAAKEHAEELQATLRANGAMWWELEKARESISAEQRETERIQHLYDEQDRTLATKLKELFDVKKQRRALMMKSTRNSPATRKRHNLHSRDIVVTENFKRRIKDAGVFTPATRAIARKLVISGCAEHAVGGVIQELGRLVGIRRLSEIPHMSARTVARIIAEGGIAARIQLGYEMMMNTSLTASGDSTSHRRQEYDSKFVALRPVTATGELSDAHVLRSMGVDASLNHSSAEQVRGLLNKLALICEIFNRSPFAKRKGLQLSFEAFAMRLRGTNGDHANDVKKDNKLLLAWKLEMTKISLGFDVLRKMSAGDVLRAVLPHARAVILAAGGTVSWGALGVADRAAREDAFTRSAAQELGERVYEALGNLEKKKLSLFLFAGCCMHKELNSVKGGDARMRAYYGSHPDIPPPVLLANKDNAAVLSGITDGQQLTAAELRALTVSGSGAVKATTLAGMICNNKDSKKGQHDRYVWFFASKLGPTKVAHRFPDVSNTRFQSHCAAACELLIHLDLYKEFMKDTVWYLKEKHAFTNIERNFYRSLHCPTTLTEMAVLALYSLCITCPYVRQIRGPGMTNLNALSLGPLHVRLKAFIAKLIDDPNIVLGTEATYETATFDGQEWEQAEVFEEIARLRVGSLPHLEVLFVEFLRGTLETWERFTAEFSPGGDIDGLTADERDEFWMPATNDANESALGGVRVNAAARPNQTLHQFEAKDTYRRNGTEGFIDYAFVEKEDHRFLHAEARALQASRPQMQLQNAQVTYNLTQAEQNKVTEAASRGKAMARQDKLNRVVLILDVEKLKPLRFKPELQDQLNIWRHRLLAPKIPYGNKLTLRHQTLAEILRLVEAYPTGLVPAEERDLPKRKEITAAGPDSVLASMGSASAAHAQVPAGNVPADGGETADSTDVLYDSEPDDL
ncbi:hypothetical protein K523DRAFT_420000 [Schizophyllum commune Tattone D]|nr:hypothetical protein K523DRAFT_420000 [Schizophyllum commune Tattone D]